MTDRQGTTKLTTNGSQGVTSTQEMDAFGREVSTTGSTASPFGFHGAEGYRNDGDNPSGLDPYQRVGARYYDRLTGRFITRDTDLSQSPYAYCDGDPVNCTDPSGHLSAVNIASGGIAISGVEDGSENAPVDTSGDNKSSSSGSTTGYGAVGGDKPSGTTGNVSTSGLNSTASLTSGGATVTATNHDGNLTGVGASSSIPLGGILSGLSFTFSDMVKFGGINSQTAGLSYQSGIFKVSLVGDSSGGVTAMAGISTH